MAAGDTSQTTPVQFTQLKQKYVLHTFWYVFPPYTVHNIFWYVMHTTKGGLDGGAGGAWPHHFLKLFL